ncbi:MAG: DUF1800 domain-containing protein [Planctomycetes bacterium]|nr:DUF1800 domain-containing protein [Planctomycetota bacterium]
MEVPRFGIGAAADLLEPFRPGKDGPWGREEAAHLARRAAFGTPPRLVAELEELGPVRAAEALLPATAAPDPEEIALVDDVAERGGTFEGVQGWLCYRLLHSPAPAREKLAIFWHGHFATSDRKVEKPRLMMRQMRRLLAHGGGGFPTLVSELAKDPAMLLWLDGNSNRAGHPNENFARELMELFTLGIGSYSEQDIQEAARAFTGWHVRADEYWFNSAAHDAGEKRIFGERGTFGGEDVIRQCTSASACAPFIAGKLCAYYLLPAPSVELRARLGELLRECRMEIGAFLRRLWASRLFFAPEARRALVSSPLDFAIGSLRTLAARANAQAVAKAAAHMGQDLLRPPSVKGWDGGASWLNSSTLLARYRFGLEVAAGGELSARVPWADLERAGAEQLVRRFFPEGLAREVEEDLRTAAGSDIRRWVAGLLQLPEYQYV